MDFDQLLKGHVLSEAEMQEFAASCNLDQYADELSSGLVPVDPQMQESACPIFNQFPFGTSSNTSSAVGLNHGMYTQQYAVSGADCMIDGSGE
jgi:hypothetical protein